jgi:hypothetical protein
MILRAKTMLPLANSCYSVRSVRRLLLDGFIAVETNPKLKSIAEIIRDAGRDQIQRMMGVLLAPEAPCIPTRTDDPEAASENSHKKRAR